MAYDDIKDPKKGSPKLSEIAVDREGELVGSAIGESSLPVIERLARIQSDALKRLGIVLHSDGNICWDITADTITSQDKGDPAVVNSGAGINLRFTQTSDVSDFDSHEDPATEALIPVDRTIDMVITAADLNANAGGLFTLAEDDILFLRITYDDINNAASPINMIPFINRVNAAVGMEALENKLDGNETTLFIPIAMRTPNWFDNIDPAAKKDLMWLVNGTTRWPSGTCAPLGSLITDLNKSLPSIFITTENEFDTALVTLGSGTGGGIICIDRPITLTGTKNIDEDIHIYGRSSSIDGDNSSLLTFQDNASLVMGDRTRLWNLGMDDTGLGHTAAFIETVGDDVIIEKCYILTDAAISAIEVNAGDNVRIRDCTISGVVGSTGIEWSGALGGTARDVTFVGLGTDNAYAVATDIDLVGHYTENEVYRGLQALPPVGSIIPIFQSYYTTANNGGGLLANIVDLSGATTLNDRYWYPCDGSEVSDVNSPIWNTFATTHVPDLTGKRFLMGDSGTFGNEFGLTAGSNSHSHVTPQANLNAAQVPHAHAIASVSVDHTHVFNHTHAWAGTAESPSAIGNYAWYTYDSAADVFGTLGLIPDSGTKPIGVVQGDTYIANSSGFPILDDFGNVAPNGPAEAMFTSWPYDGLDEQNSVTDVSSATDHDHGSTTGTDIAIFNADPATDIVDNIPLYLAVQYYIRIK